LFLSLVIDITGGNVNEETNNMGTTAIVPGYHFCYFCSVQMGEVMPELRVQAKHILQIFNAPLIRTHPPTETTQLIADHL